MEPVKGQFHRPPPHVTASPHPHYTPPRGNWWQSEDPIKWGRTFWSVKRASLHTNLIRRRTQHSRPLLPACCVSVLMRRQMQRRGSKSRTIPLSDWSENGRFITLFLASCQRLLLKEAPHGLHLHRRAKNLRRGVRL